MGLGPCKWFGAQQTARKHNHLFIVHHHQKRLLQVFLEGYKNILIYIYYRVKGKQIKLSVTDWSVFFFLFPRIQ